MTGDRILFFLVLSNLILLIFLMQFAARCQGHLTVRSTALGASAPAGVENQLHWCLVVIFSEDDSRIRKDHAPRNMTILKRLALNLLRQDNYQGSLNMKRYQAGLNNNFLLQILSNSNLF